MTKQMLVLVVTVLTVLMLAACTNTSDEKGSTTDVEPEVELPTEEQDTEGTEVDEEVDSESVSETDIEMENEPLYQLNPTTYSIEPISDANEKVVLLTIDDAPDKRALDMAKTLKALNVPAIFFVNGHFITSDEKKAVLKEIHELGFMIGNHTKTHANLKDSSEEKQKEEILSVNELVEEVTGERPVFFRAPFGINTDFSRDLAKQEGMLLMNWTFGYDWEKKYMEKKAIADIMVNTELLRNGSNLLMHDREWTADALEEIVAGLREKGYDFVDPNSIKTIVE